MSVCPLSMPLRALDAAGRHLSLTRAAIELNVTPAAVSHQIRLLERDLGVTLLERKGRGVMPTPAALAGMGGVAPGIRPRGGSGPPHARYRDRGLSCGSRPRPPLPATGWCRDWPVSANAVRISMFSSMLRTASLTSTARTLTSGIRWGGGRLSRAGRRKTLR